MASIGDLTARIGADISGLEKGIRDAERALRGMQRNFDAIGTTLTRSLTLPIIGFGVVAVKAFADADKQVKALGATMEAAGYGASSVEAELQALRQAALAPGLDFEQAVQGSIRLQNVGFSAEKSREILVQLANAIAMTGGSATELDSVTRQFGQMIGKGRILQEDLTIIQESMPAIGQAMVQAFGTKSADRLRDMGVSAEDFVNKVTKQLATLPRVSGGIGNAITNAGVAIKQALAIVGKSLDETFGITGKLDKFSEALMRGADGFAEMSAGTKALLIGVGLFAAALGPTIKLVTGFYQVVGLAYTSVLKLQVGMKTIQAGGFIAYWNTLNTAMKASIIGAVAAAVIALGIAFKALERDASAAAVAQQAIKTAGVEAKKAIAEESLEANKLADILKSETATRAQKKEALQKLNALAPQIFKNLDLERLKTDDVNKALGQYITLIEQRAKLAALNEKLVDVERQLYDTQAGLNDAVKPSLWQQAGTAILFAVDKSLAFRNAGQNVVDNLDAVNASLTEQKTKITEEIAKLEQAGVSQKKFASTTNASSNAVKNQADAFDQLIAAQEKAEANRQKALKAATALGIQPLEALPTGDIAAPLAGMDSEISVINTGLTAMNEIMAAVGQTMSANASYTYAFNEALEAGVAWTDIMNASLARVNETNSLTGKIALAAGQAMMQSAQQGAISLKSLALAAVAAAGQIIKSYIMEGVAASVSKALKSVPFPFNIAAGAAAGAIAGTLFQGLLNKVNVPALAKGGLAYSPTLAMVGDNRNASVDPEVIAPLSKLEGMIGGNSGGMRGEFVVRGADLVLVLERANQQNQRLRGY